MAYEDARVYLARVVPWDRKHYISVHHKVQDSRPEAKAKWPLPGKPVLTPDQVINTLDFWAPKTDTYVCLASQVAVENKSYNGKTFVTARRTIENAAFRKCLCMDFDVKGGCYATMDDAKRALGEFIKWAGLPGPTIIVASGTGGFHVYWTFRESIGIAVWRPLAHALVRMALEYGIKFDTGCTTDPVRVLRVPGTLNHKPGGPYPVSLLYSSKADLLVSAVEYALSGYIGLDTPLPAGAEVTFAGNVLGVPQDDDDSLGAGITKRFPPSNIARVALVCPHLRNTLDSAGAECGQPLWFLDLRLATCCEEGRAVAHSLSSGHAGYHPAETDEVYDRLIAEKEARPSIGPPKCQTMLLAGAKECITCPNLKLGVSPLNVPGAFAAAPTVVLPGGASLPDGYARADNGSIYMVEVDDQNHEHRTIVFPYQIAEPWIESGREYALNFTTVEEADTVKCVRIPFKELADMNASGRALAAEGLPMRVTPKVQDFIMSFLKRLRDSAGSIVRCEPVGWHHYKGELKGFAYNGILYTKDGERQAQHMESELRVNYTPVGDSQIWASAVRIINAQQRPPLDMLVLSAFASPLIQFAHQSGVSIGGWSNESGVGKTTALQIAQAVWGHPVRASGGLNDTANATFRRAGLTRNLPLIWDEIKTQKQTITFVETIFTMTGGREKARLNRSARAAHQGEWQSILTYASNSSMSDAIVDMTRSTTAGHVRIFEFQVPRVDNFELVSTMAKLQDALRTNFGHAGVIYAKWLGENFEHAAKVVGLLYTDLEAKWKIKEDERYWNAIMAATLAAGLFANQLGLTEVDMPGLKTWLRIEFDRMRGNKDMAPNDFSRVDNIVSTLGQFLAEKRAMNTLRTDNVPAGAGRPPPNSIKIIEDGPAADRLGEIQVQVAVGPRIIRVADHALTHWCKRENIPKSAMIEGMRTKLAARHCLVRLGSGTRLAGTSIPVWELLVSGTPLDSAVDW